MQAHRRQIRVALQKLRDLIVIGIQQTGPARAFAFRFSSPLAVVLLQHPVHAFAVDS